jgi:hypothetical protein
MQRRDPENLITVRKKLIDSGVTPSISKQTVQEKVSIVLSIQFYDEYTGQPGTPVEFFCPVEDFYTYQTRVSQELTRIDQVISWIESH